MTKENLIHAFAELGHRLKNLSLDTKEAWAREAEIYNKWFTAENIYEALAGIVYMLEAEKLNKWLSAYALPAEYSKTIGVVMAGNIPAVGFHDFLSVLISGNILHAKLSSDDKILLPKIANLLIEIEPSFKDKIFFVEKLKDIDAVIATGSDNTAKHFEYYFSKIPRIIRCNRVSVAVLNGKESEEELRLLGRDMLQYFGLGCRNVAKIFVPEEMKLNRIFEALEERKKVVDTAKYSNNYEYNRSIYLLKNILHLDNGFMIAVETKDMVSPISVFYYEKYKNIDSVKTTLEEYKDKIQCIVSQEESLDGTVPFGKAQSPELWDYADGRDTLLFLTEEIFEK